MHINVVSRLKSLHARLDHDIRAELARRMPNRERVTRLKKIKLMIKDRLAVLSCQQSRQQAIQ